MSNRYMEIILILIQVLNLFMINCFGSDIRNLHFRIDDRYKDRIPETGILWTKSSVEVRWCLFVCVRDVDCVSIFFDKTTCHGFSEKIHDMISIRTVTGMKYYELSGPVGNVAAGKTAVQSSYLFDDDIRYGPQRALDSRRYPFQNEKNPNMVSCSHTSKAVAPLSFWQVDLGSTYSVLALSFLSRIECCGARNQRLNITVAQTASGPRVLCVYYPGPAFKGQMKTFFCEKPVTGQFVRISRDRLILNPCEIEVYGYPLGNFPI